MSTPAEGWELFIRWIVGLMFVLVSTLPFLELAGDVWIKEGFPWLDQLMLFITQTGSNVAVVVLGIVLYRLWRQGRKLNVLTLLVSFGGAVSINAVLKLLFARPRPHVFPPLVQADSYSFPRSCHCSRCSLRLIGHPAVAPTHRGWTVLSALWVFLVGLSRIYLGVHYPSDVLGSLALGSLWLFVVMAGHNGLYAIGRAFKD